MREARRRTSGIGVGRTGGGGRGVEGGVDWENEKGTMFSWFASTCLRGAGGGTGLAVERINPPPHAKQAPFLHKRHRGKKRKRGLLGETPRRY